MFYIDDNIMEFKMLLCLEGHCINKMQYIIMCSVINITL